MFLNVLAILDKTMYMCMLIMNTWIIQLKGYWKLSLSFSGDKLYGKVFRKWYDFYNFSKHNTFLLFYELCHKKIVTKFELGFSKVCREPLSVNVKFLSYALKWTIDLFSWYKMLLFVYHGTWSRKVKLNS